MHSRSLLALLLSSGLTACGGGGGSSGTTPTTNTPTTTTPTTNTPVVQKTFQGTAAVGLPLTGNVTVKDSTGKTKTVPIQNNGSYSVDVSDMTAPFVFRAQGSAGGKTYAVHSAATEADLGGTINITQLTDLIVSNIAGQVAENYFNAGTFSGLTKVELDAETAALKAKLLPVLTSLGVDSSIDLLRTGFTPLSSALDKALDVIRVTVDSSTNVATISNLVNQQQITDNLAAKAAADATTTPLPSTGMATTTADDIAAIRTLFKNFSAEFANGSPSPAKIASYLTSTTHSGYAFRQNDKNDTTFANDLSGDTNLAKVEFGEITVRRINYTIDANNLAPRAFLDFTVVTKDGVDLGGPTYFQVVKGTDGTWKLRGNAKVFNSYANAHMTKDVASGCVTTGLEFGIEDYDSSNSANVDHVIVTGPGLPTVGLKYAKPTTGGYFKLAQGTSQDGGQPWRLASTCVGVPTTGASDANIASINTAVWDYTFTAKTAAGATAQFNGVDIVWREPVQKRPMTLAEAQAASFPSFNSNPGLASYTGGAISVSVTGLNPKRWGEAILELIDPTGLINKTDAELIPSSTGTASTNLTLTAPATIAKKSLRVATRDAFDRTLMTMQNLP